MNTHHQDSILVVDDIPANIKVLLEFLSQVGFKVAVAKSGESALERIKEISPDLILLDVLMPGMDGFETCRRLKSNPTTKDIPVIFLTALSEVIDKVQGLQLGAVDYITKPIDREEALARIRVHLELRKAQLKLVQEEKMASLGQLIAGVAHEINNPLAAIQASIENITAILDHLLQQLPQLAQKLPLEHLPDFLAVLKLSRPPQESLSFREERQLRRTLTQILESRGIENATTLAEILSKMGLLPELSPLMPLLHVPDNRFILETVYNLSALQTNSQTIRLAVERAAKIVLALKNYVRQDAFGEKSNASIPESIDTVLMLYHNQMRQGIEVTKRYELVPLISCYPEELTQVWSNLISNAIQAMNYRGQLDIAVSERDQHIVAQVTDTGPGIPTEIQDRIFEPFFTTKQAGEGSGLGLDIVRKIIDKHNGRVEVESEPGHTTFRIWLPMPQT